MAICLRHPLRLQSLHKNTFYYIITINHDFENKEETMKLYENGAYLVNGRDVVINSPEAASAVQAKTGKTVTPEDAKKQTIAYGILKNHNTSGNMENCRSNLIS